jgi:hypothetical protein
VRPQHLIRTYHTIDPAIVPSYEERSGDCLLSGAISDAYPLRKRIHRELHKLPVRYLQHPGYHRKGCCTPQFLQILRGYRVAICTASRYGYALRKLIEATAAGCVVITDLPEDEVMPEIDANLIRIHPSIPTQALGKLVQESIETYDPSKQALFAARAKDYYDYRKMGLRLTQQIDGLQEVYP